MNNLHGMISNKMKRLVAMASGVLMGCCVAASGLHAQMLCELRQPDSWSGVTFGTLSLVARLI